MTEQICDFLIRIKNAYQVGKKTTQVPCSSLKEKVATLLVSEGFLKKAEVKKEKSRKSLIITLAYQGKKPAISQVEIVSKPSLKVYVKKNKIPKVLGGLGISLFSTSCGLMTGSQARKKGLGGILIAKIW